ncbi:MAG TPA: GGDEF domain-containing protein [Candidatus Limnocylindria bacterium]
MLRPVWAESYNDLVVLAVIVALLVNLFFLFKVVPWSKPGSWRRIWALAAIASAMFILSEAAILTDNSITALDSSHQIPLFGALLAGATGFFLVYTDAYRAAERSRILALTDPLTELPNRRAFEERLKLAFERKEPFALLYVDLDGFKQINDRLGHAAGDDVLREVGAILRQAVRQADMASRIGGDEFCLLLAAADADSTRVVAERVLAGLRALPISRGAPLSASFGIATHRDGSDPEEVVAAADAAMYRAKREGGTRIAFAPGLAPAQARTSA